MKQFAVSEDSENVPQQAVGSRCSVASTVPALMNVDSVSSIGKPVRGYKSIIETFSSTDSQAQGNSCEVVNPLQALNEACKHKLIEI